jgi:glycogen debranching enzyme
VDSVFPEEDRYSIVARTSLTTRVLKHGETFGVFDRKGDIRSMGVLGPEGLYHEGTRFLSHLRLQLADTRLLLLSSTVRENNLLFVADLTNGDSPRTMGEAPVAHGALHVLRSRFLLEATCYEHLQIANYADSAMDLTLQIAFASDFADLFEVRGTPRATRGRADAARHEGDQVVLGYTALDGQRLATRIHFSPMPDVIGETRADIRLHLPSKQSKDVYVTVQCESALAPRRPAPAFEQAHAIAAGTLAAREAEECTIDSSNEDFNSWIGRSISDLHMLVSETPYGPYPYAGVPWFSTPFGRDGIITALEALWVNPKLARGVLSFLAAMQAETIDVAADAEPGKILHELRLGEMARLREIPFGRYYGSVDSTPLFVVLAAAYHEVSGDTAFIEQLYPHIERALRWMDDHGDPDRDGFLEYDQKSRDGLVQQGWKDSHDSVFHADGSPAKPPIALCEVQGYAYAARRGAARLCRVLGRTDRAARLELEADALRARFDEAFWCEELSTYALALDGDKRACRVRTSNPGHCLLMGIVRPERAAQLAEQLLSPEMFSGWGIRTLASSERRYNPMSYHNGSIWPHDNALIAAGLAQYGFTQAALRVLEGLFDASRYVDLHRLPELFCGFPRRPGEGPTLYPVACAPQAWAAAAPLMMLQATLGMSVSAEHACVRFKRAVLPAFLEELELRRLQVGQAGVDLKLHRYPDNVGLNVLGRRGRVEVMTVK